MKILVRSLDVRTFSNSNVKVCTIVFKMNTKKSETKV